MPKATIRLEKKWFEENKQRFINAGNANLEQDDELYNNYYEIEFDVSVASFDFDGSENEGVGYEGYMNTAPHGQIWIDRPLNDDMRMKIAEVVVKRLNKAKALLESLK